VIIIVEIVVLIHVFLWWHEKKEGGKEWGVKKKYANK
jgi:hypothetical protein